MSVAPKLHCHTHPQREAAARCASCGQFFCRECVTEHELQMLCAACFRAAGDKPEKPARKRIWLIPLTVAVQLVLAMLMVWVSFYLVGRLVVAIPSDFHEGTVWQEIEIGVTQ